MQASALKAPAMEVATKTYESAAVKVKSMKAKVTCEIARGKRARAVVLRGSKVKHEQWSDQSNAGEEQARQHCGEGCFGPVRGELGIQSAEEVVRDH